MYRIDSKNKLLCHKQNHTNLVSSTRKTYRTNTKNHNQASKGEVEKKMSKTILISPDGRRRCIRFALLLLNDFMCSALANMYELNFAVPIFLGVILIFQLV